MSATAFGAPISVQPMWTSTVYTVNLAIETDYELYTKFGSSTDAELRFIGDLTAAASAIYWRDVKTVFKIGTVHLWSTSADPWTATSTSTALSEMLSYWNSNYTSVQRTIVHMLSGKNMGGGIAYVGVLCNSSFGYGLSSSLGTTFSVTNPNLYWDVLCYTHEIGHNFSSPHTECYAPPVDTCTPCDSFSCTGSVPSGGGTIMSYCHACAGGYSNIILYFGLNGDVSQAVLDQMRGYVESKAACLGPLAAAPTVTGIAPGGGPTNGGTAVTISGTGFQAFATVTIGGVKATGVTIVSSTTITATTGLHTAGAVNVVVQNPDSQTGTLASAYTYGAVPPVIGSFGASLYLVRPGAPSTLSWVTSGADSLTLNGGSVARPSGSQVVNPTTTTLYTLVATNVVGSVSKMLTVNVDTGTGPLSSPVVATPLAGQTLLNGGVSFSWGAVGGATGLRPAAVRRRLRADRLLRLPRRRRVHLRPAQPPRRRLHLRRPRLLRRSERRHLRRLRLRQLLHRLSRTLGRPHRHLPHPGRHPLHLHPDPGLDLRRQGRPRLPDALRGRPHRHHHRPGRAPDLASSTRPPPSSPCAPPPTTSSRSAPARPAAERGRCRWTSPSPSPPSPPTSPSSPTPRSSGGNSLSVWWTSVPRADLYQIQVVQPTSGPGGGALTVAAMQVSATTVTLPIPAGAATIFVWGCTGDGCGPQSVGWDITAPGPNPSTPNLGTPLAGSSVTGPSVMFSWNRIPGDNGSNTEYRLYVGDNARSRPALDVYTTANYYAANFKAEGTRYDALVIAKPRTASPVQGPATGFLVRGPSGLSPTMVQPAYGFSVPQGNVTIEWTPLPGASLYEYYVAQRVTPPATPVIFRGVTPGLSVQVPLKAIGAVSTNYLGIVRACPSGATCTAGSDAGWGIWSDQPGGGGLVEFTVTP